MESTSSETTGNGSGTDRVHQESPGAASTDNEPLQKDIILDAMNITIDKVTTVIALKTAERDFSKISVALRKDGKNDLANFYSDMSVSVGVLLSQIETHGGRVSPTN